MIPPPVTPPPTIQRSTTQVRGKFLQWNTNGNPTSQDQLTQSLVDHNIRGYEDEEDSDSDSESSSHPTDYFLQYIRPLLVVYTSNYLRSNTVEMESSESETESSESHSYSTSSLNRNSLTEALALLKEHLSSRKIESSSSNNRNLREILQLLRDVVSECSSSLYSTIPKLCESLTASSESESESNKGSVGRLVKEILRITGHLELETALHPNSPSHSDVSSL